MNSEEKKEMPKRKTKPIDYDNLLQSLQGSSGEPESDAPAQENSLEKKCENAHTDAVSQAARKRASKLSDPRNGYVYSTKERIIHDRTCKRVSGISDECFEMSKKLIPGMPLCNLCRRKAWIRLGMGDDTKFIDAYDRFFREAYVSNDLLQRLFVDNEVKVKIRDITHMTFDVNGERWMWERVGRKIVLFHNNYIISDIGTRVIKSDYHQQTEKANSAVSAVHRMLDYSWDLSHRKKDAELEGKYEARPVAITEFRKHFGRYMDMVIKGETLILTRYGKEVAMIKPVNGRNSLDGKKSSEQVN